MQREVLQTLKHYENLPMQYTKIFKVVKDESFQYKKLNPSFTV